MANEKILVIDDERTARILLVDELEKAGYHVFQATDGDVGLQVIRASKPDLIISDVLMPQVDGNILLKTVRDREYSKDIPFIVLSARGQMKAYFESLDVDGFIEKPFVRDDLLTKVREALDKSKEAKVEQKAHEEEEAGVAKKCLIILDDQDDLIEQLKITLVEQPFELQVTKTVTECLDMAVKYKPVLIGVRFETDGIGKDQSISMMREIPHVQNVPFLVYGENLSEEDNDAIKTAGIEHVISKVNEKKLLEMIQEIIA